MLRQMFYILVDRKPIVAPSTVVWTKWLEKENRYVANDEIGGIQISTAFLGINYAFSKKDEPLLFETLIKGGPLDGHTWRYSTWEQAEEGHAAAIKRVKTMFN